MPPRRAAIEAIASSEPTALSGMSSFMQELAYFNAPERIDLSTTLTAEQILRVRQVPQLQALLLAGHVA